MVCKFTQQIKFSFCQAQFHSTFVHHAELPIEFDITQALDVDDTHNSIWFDQLRSSQCRPNPGCQFFSNNWFRHIIICTCLETGYEVVSIGLCSNHDDRHN